MADDKNVVSDEVYARSVFQEGGSLVVDLAGVEEAKFPLIPAGIYDAEIDDWTFGPSENSGAMMFTAVFRLLHPDYEKVKQRTYFSFSQKALPYTKAGLNRFAKDVFGEPFDPQKIADSGIMMGRKVRLRIVQAKDDQGFSDTGRINRVNAVLPPLAEGEGNGAAKSGGSGFFS